MATFVLRSAPDDLWKRLKACAAREGKGPRAIMIEAVKAYVETSEIDAGRKDT